MTENVEPGVEDESPGEAAALHRRLGKVLEDLLRELPSLSLPELPGWARMGGFPPVEVRELEDELVVTADLPGIRSEDVKVSLAGRTLILAGTRNPAEDDRRGDALRAERRFGEFRRELDLDVDVQAEGIAARLSNGVLTLRLPKLPPPPEVEIQVD